MSEDGQVSVRASVVPPVIPPDASLKLEYEAGATIREMAAKYLRSYGWMHEKLSRAGVRFRKRGGARPRSGRPRTRTAPVAPGI